MTSTWPVRNCTMITYYLDDSCLSIDEQCSDKLGQQHGNDSCCYCRHGLTTAWLPILLVTHTLIENGEKNKSKLLSLYGKNALDETLQSLLQRVYSRFWDFVS